jgi:hypothetical protein
MGSRVHVKSNLSVLVLFSLVALAFAVGTTVLALLAAFRLGLPLFGAALAAVRTGRARKGHQGQQRNHVLHLCSFFGFFDGLKLDSRPPWFIGFPPSDLQEVAGL